MRIPCKSVVLSAALLAGAAIAASADQLDRWSSPGSQLSTVAPSSTVPTALKPAPVPLSNYDPYTGGASSCPEGGTDGGSQCAHLIPRSYPIR